MFVEIMFFIGILITNYPLAEWGGGGGGTIYEFFITVKSLSLKKNNFYADLSRISAKTGVW